MFTILYWHDWTPNNEPCQFSRESLEEARARLAHYLSFDPDIRIVVHKDNVRLSVSAFLNSQEVAA